MDETDETDDIPETRLPLVVDELTIRRIGRRDRWDLHEYWSDPEVARYQFGGPLSEFQVKAAQVEHQENVKPGDPGVALVLAAELADKVIGDCTLLVTSVDDRQAEIGFRFNPRFTGRGKAGDTNRCGRPRVRVRSTRGAPHRGVNGHTECTVVWRLMERVGMQREGPLYP